MSDSSLSSSSESFDECVMDLFSCCSSLNIRPPLPSLLCLWVSLSKIFLSITVLTLRVKMLPSLLAFFAGFSSPFLPSAWSRPLELDMMLLGRPSLNESMSGIDGFPVYELVRVPAAALPAAVLPPNSDLFAASAPSSDSVFSFSDSSWLAEAVSLDGSWKSSICDSLRRFTSTCYSWCSPTFLSAVPSAISLSELSTVCSFSFFLLGWPSCPGALCFVVASSIIWFICCRS